MHLHPTPNRCAKDCDTPAPHAILDHNLNHENTDNPSTIDPLHDAFVDANSRLGRWRHPKRKCEHTSIPFRRRPGKPTPSDEDPYLEPERHCDASSTTLE